MSKFTRNNFGCQHLKISPKSCWGQGSFVIFEEETYSGGRGTPCPLVGILASRQRRFFLCEPEASQRELSIYFSRDTWGSIKKGVAHKTGVDVEVADTSADTLMPVEVRGTSAETPLARPKARSVQKPVDISGAEVHPCHGSSFSVRSGVSTGSPDSLVSNDDIQGGDDFGFCDPNLVKLVPPPINSNAGPRMDTSS